MLARESLLLTLPLPAIVRSFLPIDAHSIATLDPVTSNLLHTWYRQTRIAALFSFHMVFYSLSRHSQSGLATRPPRRPPSQRSNAVHLHLRRQHSCIPILRSDRHDSAQSPEARESVGQSLAVWEQTPERCPHRCGDRLYRGGVVRVGRATIEDVEGETEEGR